MSCHPICSARFSLMRRAEICKLFMSFNKYLWFLVHFMSTARTFLCHCIPMTALTPFTLTFMHCMSTIASKFFYVTLLVNLRLASTSTQIQLVRSISMKIKFISKVCLSNQFCHNNLGKKLGDYDYSSTIKLSANKLEIINQSATQRFGMQSFFDNFKPVILPISPCSTEVEIASSNSLCVRVTATR